TIGGEYDLPQTDAQVWLAPRAVHSAQVKTPGGEAEQYLFYRGVGNLPSPLTVARNKNDDGIVVRENLDAKLGLRAPLLIRAMWLVHVREDGSVAFKNLGSAKLAGQAGREVKRCLADFSVEPNAADRSSPSRPLAEQVIDDGYSEENLGRLRSAMRKELIADG